MIEMVETANKEELEWVCREAGFYMTTYSPGDGVTRYRFDSKDEDYFATNGDYTALGIAEARVYVAGRLDGCDAKRREG